MDIKSIKKGTILVVRQPLNDKFFHRSVILITEHNEEGTIGYIINKPQKTSFEELNKMFFFGGPVQSNKLFYFHKRPDLIKNSIHIINDIYMAKQILKIDKNENIHHFEFMFFFGYCKWAPLQLEEEIKNNIWHVINKHNINIFNKFNDDLWIKMMKKIGGENLIWLNTPSDPSMN